MLCEISPQQNTHTQLPTSQNHPPSHLPIRFWGPPPASCSSPFKSQGAPPDSHALGAKAPTALLRPWEHSSLPTANWNAVFSPSKSGFSVFLYFPTEQSLVLLYKAVPCSQSSLNSLPWKNKNRKPTCLHISPTSALDPFLSASVEI